MGEVLWQEWGEEAFAEARKLDRPILLDIGAVWCHWCHVMDHGIPGDSIHTGTYSDPAIIETINRDFIPVKVDNDRRPDINARYNMGGWPTTAFLTPDGEPLYGATYLTPGQMSGLLDNISNYYHGNKDEIVRKVQEYAEKQKRFALSSSVPGEISQDVVEYVASEIKRHFDRAFGGFGTQPKFPHPEALNLAIECFALTEDEDLRIIAIKTLTEMASGGMYDQYAGGFFRYSTTRDWSIPHYEKMLEDNSRLLSTNLLAYQVFGDDQFKQIALDVRRFLLDVMYDRRLGIFAGSQDADQEDAYYGRPLSERELMPTPYIDWTVYADWNALVVSAFVEIYKQLGDNESLEIAVRLYDFLSHQLAPNHYFVDGRKQGTQNLLTDIAAHLGAALDLFEAIGAPRYLSEARGLADIAISELLVDEVGKFRDAPVQPNALGALNLPKFDHEDNAITALHLIRLADHTGSSRYLAIAEAAIKALCIDYREQSYFSSALARAVNSYLLPPVHIVLVGATASTEMEQLQSAAYRAFAMRKSVELRSAEDPGEYPADPDGRPAAYVCIGETCSRPLFNSSDLTQMLKAHAELNGRPGN